MDSAYYAACSAIISRAQALETIANNLANSSTAGYRSQHNVFQSLVAQADWKPSSPLNQAVNSFGVLSGTRMDTAQGSLTSTGNDLDLAIEGSGYFVVQTAAGKVYTRSGNFHVSPKNELVTAAGDKVLGESGPVQVLGNPLSISSDGTISVAGALAGKLKIVEFPADAAMESIGQSYYSTAARATTDAINSQVRQGMVEGSNVNPVESVVELVAVQREAEMMHRVLALVHGELNKTATQELPRVNG